MSGNASLGGHSSRTYPSDTAVRPVDAKLAIFAPVHHGGSGLATRNALPIQDTTLGTNARGGVDDAVLNHRSAKA